MVLLEAVVVIGLVWAVVYGTIRLLGSPPAPVGAAVRAGTWRTAHYDLKDQTHVVVQKVSQNGEKVLDEHTVATVRVEDPEYDAKFLAAMATARERRALFEAEDKE